MKSFRRLLYLRVVKGLDQPVDGEPAIFPKLDQVGYELTRVSQIALLRIEKKDWEG